MQYQEYCWAGRPHQFLIFIGLYKITSPVLSGAFSGLLPCNHVESVSALAFAWFLSKARLTHIGVLFRRIAVVPMTSCTYRNAWCFSFLLHIAWVRRGVPSLGLWSQQSWLCGTFLLGVLVLLIVLPTFSDTAIMFLEPGGYCYFCLPEVDFPTWLCHAVHRVSCGHRLYCREDSVNV